MSSEFADTLVLKEISRFITESDPSSIIPARAWAEQIKRDIPGSAFSTEEIIDEIVLLAAQSGVSVEFGTKGRCASRPEIARHRASRLRKRRTL